MDKIARLTQEIQEHVSQIQRAEKTLEEFPIGGLANFSRSHIIALQSQIERLEMRRDLARLEAKIKSNLHSYVQAETVDMDDTTMMLIEFFAMVQEQEETHEENS